MKFYGDIAIIGKIDVHRKIARGGQISKTRGILHAITERFGTNRVKMIDLTEYKKRPFMHLFSIISACFKYRIIVVVLSYRGISAIMPIIILMKKFVKNVVLYSAIGGLIADHCHNNLLMRYSLKKTDKIYVEIKDIIPKLQMLGIKNVEYAPTFSEKISLERPNFSSLSNEPYKLVTYSRITQKKGIGEAIKAVVTLNRSFRRNKYVLDICGVIDPEYEGELNRLIDDSNKEEIKVIGKLEDSEVVEMLSKHAALLFPTSHLGEGFPATLVESMMAGVPILASNFAHNSSIVSDGYNGYLYDPVDGVNGLVDIIEKYFSDLTHAKQMKENCINESKRYTPEVVCKSMLKFINLKLKE